MTLLLYLVADAGRRGYERLLEAFWDECASYDVPLPQDEPVSAVAFCNARKKIRPELVRELLRHAAEDFDETYGWCHRWKGRRVLACDGMKISVQRSDELWKEFGGPEGGHCPQALVSTLYDVMSRVPVDCNVVPYASCERTQFLEMIDRVGIGDLVLLDRGYPSYEILTTLIDRKIDFVVRVPADMTFKAVESFVVTGAFDQLIDIERPRNVTVGDETIRVRAIYRERKDAEQPTVLLTSVRRREATAAEIDDLYGRRWAVEELYKLEKGDYLGQRQFHAKYADGIRQEIYALLLFITIARFLTNAAARDAGVRAGHISQKAALLATAAHITRLCMANPETAHVRRLLARIARALDPPRPGRSYPRRSLKPPPRWGPTGRRWTANPGG